MSPPRRRFNGPSKHRGQPPDPPAVGRAEAASVTATAAESAASDVPGDWYPGLVVADLYEVAEELGAGGMGVVHKVHHRTWDVDLAVKSPRPELLAGLGGVEAFVAEAELWVKLPPHPNICTCHYVRVLGGIPRVFAEYMAGGSLADHIAEFIDLPTLLDVAIQMAWGLAAAHRAGVVHQDVKPANVLLTREGVAKVTDFGLARAQARAQSTDPSASPVRSPLVSWAGMTPAYASPEQVRGDDLTAATDVFSFGVSLLELLTGEISWRIDPAARDSVERYLRAGRGFTARVNIPPAVAVLLRSLLAEDPQARPAMTTLATQLPHLYAEVIGSPYLREEPKEAELLADEFSNRALSMLDLGKDDESRRVWDQALRVDPYHAPSTYNRGLLLWRAGEITDEEFVRRMEVVRADRPHSWEAVHLLALVHIERGDHEAAARLLEEVKRAGAQESPVADVLKIARAGMMGRRAGPQYVRAHRGRVWSVVVDRQAQRVLSASSEGESVQIRESADGNWMHVGEIPAPGVLSVGLDHGGRTVVLGHRDGTVRVWGMLEGDCRAVLRGHTKYVTTVALLPDDHQVVSGSHDGTLRLWNRETAACIRVFRGHRGKVRAVALTRNGQYIVSASDWGELRVWDRMTGACLQVMQMEGLSANAVSLVDEHILAGYSDGRLRLWDRRTGTLTRTLGSDAGSVREVRTTTDEAIAVSIHADPGALQLWNIRTGRCIRTIDLDAGPASIDLSSNDRVVVGLEDGRVGFWKLTDLETPHSPWYYARPRSAVILSETGDTITSASARSRSVSGAHDLQTAAEEIRRARSIEGLERHPVLLAAWHAVGSLGTRSALSGAWQVRAHIDAPAGQFSLPSGQPLRFPGVTCLAMSDSGGAFASGHRGDTIHVLDLQSSGTVVRLEGGSDWSFLEPPRILRDPRPRMEPVAKLHAILSQPIVEGLWFAGDGSLLFAESRNAEDRVLRLWDLETGKCARHWNGTTDTIQSAVLDAHATTALVSGSAGLLEWDLRSGDTELLIPHPLGRLRALLPERRLVASGPDGFLSIWDIQSDKCHRRLKQQGEVTCAMPTPDGSCVLVATADGTVWLWNIESGSCIQMWDNATDPEYALALSPEGRFAISGGHSGLLRVWDTKSGVQVGEFEGHKGAISAVALSRDGRYAITGGWDNKVLIWELDWEYAFPGG
jgi:WD40 repeat protein/serine/threonine protein kinase